MKKKGKKKPIEVRRAEEEETLREIVVKIGLERINNIRRYSSRGFTGQWDNKVGNEFRICEKEGVQVEENQKSNLCKKCEQNFLQEHSEHIIEVNIYY